METDRDYHIRRARDELDLAYRTEHLAAAAAHLKLCGLHMAWLHDPDHSESAESVLSGTAANWEPALVLADA